MNTPALHAFTHVSVSQIQSWVRCCRLWWFDKILKLPREEQPHFIFGSTLHACAERVLLGREPFPSGWDRELPEEGMSTDIEELIKGATERGILKPLPEQFVEKKIELSMGDDRPILIGYIDHGSMSEEKPEVVDHKTTGSLRWARNVMDLLEDLQMQTYAFAVLLLYREKYQKNPPHIIFRHNVFVKGLVGNGSALARALGAKEEERWKVVGGDEDPRARFAIKDLEEHWARMCLLVDKMKEDAEITDWRSFPDPPRTACEMYNGCLRATICHEGQSIPDHVASLSTKDATMTEEKKTTAASALAKFKKRAVPKPKPTKSEPEPETTVIEEEQTTPPWYRPDCPACKGSPNGPGFKKKDPVPCGICVMWASENGKPSPDEFVIHVDSTGGTKGRPTWHQVGEEGGEDPTNVNGPIPEELKPQPQADPKAFGVEIEEKPMPEEPPKRKRGRPKGSKNRRTKEREEAAAASAPAVAPTTSTTFVLAINCLPLSSKQRVVRLVDLFTGPEPWWAEKVAEGLDRPGMPWNGLDPFKRVDAAIGLIPMVKDRLAGSILVASTGPHEFRGLIEALRSYATECWMSCS